jgi:hypothetical protein
MHTTAMTPATGSMRSAMPRRLLKLATATASPPTRHDFAIFSFREIQTSHDQQVRHEVRPCLVAQVLRPVH